MGSDACDRDETMTTVLSTMAHMVEALRDDAQMLSGPAAQRLSRQFVERTRCAPVRPLASLEAASAADSITVQWRHGLDAGIERSADHIVMRLPDKEMSFPRSCGPALYALRSGVIADADSLAGLDSSDATVLIRRLLREAVVVPVNP
jgi:hypothetical protein